MKKLFFLIIISIFSLCTYGQDYEYIGKIDATIISKMYPSELLMYSKSIGVIGKDYEIIEWASEDICQIIKKEPYYFKCESVTLSSKNNNVRISPKKGKTTLGSEKLVLILKRQKNESIITLLVLY